MIGEAIDTAITLGWALLGWIVFFATIGSILILAAVATGAWGVRAIRRRHTGPLAAEQPPADPIPRRTAERRTAPSWARTEHDHQEAA